MEYMLLSYVNESGWPELTKSEQAQWMAAYRAYTEALKGAGILRGSGRLQSSGAATTVRVVDGRPRVLDGPYADTKEQLGGYYVIDVPDLDAAISWASRCPGTNHGTIEVRPLWAMPG